MLAFSLHALGITGIPVDSAIVVPTLHVALRLPGTA
jgi:hypothetical protein